MLMIKADLEIKAVGTVPVPHRDGQTVLVQRAGGCGVQLSPVQGRMFLGGLGVCPQFTFLTCLLGGMGVSLARKMVFDTPEEDPNYNPLPEDRPENQPRDRDQNQQQHPQ